MPVGTPKNENISWGHGPSGCATVCRVPKLCVVLLYFMFLFDFSIMNRTLAQGSDFHDYFLSRFRLSIKSRVSQ